jgi:hypothetical protein
MLALQRKHMLLRILSPLFLEILNGGEHQQDHTTLLFRQARNQLHRGWPL